MNPIRFAQANVELGRPASMTEEQCAALWVYRGNDESGTAIVISCWQPTPEERAMIAAGGPVWLSIIGNTMQPALVSAKEPWE